MKRKIRTSNTGLPTRLPFGKREGSILVDDTPSMERRRREAEQDFERAFGRVLARNHSEQESQAPALGQEGELQNNIQQHPEPALNTQARDGIDSPLNPIPALNTDARREFDNVDRDQKIAQQLRLGNMPGYKAPRPERP